MDVSFVVVSPATQKRSVAVRLPILVGRSEEAKFRIQQDSVSRRHCEFFVKDEVVFVRDLGSTNGTLLDDEQIAASVATRVRPGAVVRVGGVAFRIDYDSAAVTGEPEAVRGDDTLPLPASAPEAAEHEAEAAVPKEDAPPADDNLNDFLKSLS